MNRSSDFQTGRLVLLASTVMCGGLAVAILVPFSGQTELPSGKPTSQPTTSTAAPLQPNRAYSEFYPAGQTLTSAPQTNVAQPSGKELFAGQGTVAPGPQPGRLTGRQNRNQVSGSARPVAQSPALAPIPNRLPASRAQTTVVRHAPGLHRASTDGRGTLALTAAKSTSDAPDALTDSEFAAQNRRQYSCGATAFDDPYSRLSGEAGPPGSVYAPITVHPVTVNVDGGIMADQMATMTARFEKLLESRDLARQQMEVAEAVAKKRRAARAERPNVQPADNSAQMQQLAQLNQNLQDIAKSFERFQTETQRTVNEISNEGRRAELAYAEIRSVQRQLESQLERVRLKETQQAAVIQTPVTRVATGPSASVPDVPTSEAPRAVSVDVPAGRPLATPSPAAASLTTRPEQTPTTQTVAPLARFNIPPTSVPAVPFSVAEDELIKGTDELPTPIRRSAAPIVEVIIKKAVTAPTKVSPQCSAPGPVPVSPEMTGGVHLPRASVREQPTSERLSKNPEIPPQTKTDETSGRLDDQSSLLLAYKARRLLQEAQEAMEAGETAIACSRAMQARSLASSAAAQNMHQEYVRARTNQRDGTATVPAAAATLATTSKPSGSPRTETKHQQAVRLVVQARAAIAAGELQRATDLASQAKALGASYGLFDDCPFLVREDITWLTEARVASSVDVQKNSVRTSSASGDELRDQDPVEAVRTAKRPVTSELVPLVDYTDPAERDMVKTVAFEHVYRFELADVQPAAESSREPSLSGVPCKQCGKIHATGTATQHKFVADSKPPRQTQKKNLFVPKGARRSNRRTVEDSDDSSEADAIWDAPAFSWATKNKTQNEPSTLHRLSSAIRRLGRPATE